MDVENLQLIDRLHSMSSEIAILKTTIDERTHEVNELHRALEDAAVFESSMRVEIEQHQMMVEEQRNENRMLQVWCLTNPCPHKPIKVVMCDNDILYSKRGHRLNN